MRLLPAYLARLRRTMNAIAWRVESDPDQTDRIVRPRRNDQLGRVMKLTLGRDGRAGVDAFVKSPVTFRLLYP